MFFFGYQHRGNVGMCDCIRTSDQPTMCPQKVNLKKHTVIKTTKEKPRDLSIVVYLYGSTDDLQSASH
jgi:hypothetical protein